VIALFQETVLARTVDNVRPVLGLVLAPVPKVFGEKTVSSRVLAKMTVCAILSLVHVIAQEASTVEHPVKVAVMGLVTKMLGAILPLASASVLTAFTERIVLDPTSAEVLVPVRHP